MYKYIEVVAFKDKVVVVNFQPTFQEDIALRMDVTDKSERSIEKIESGVNINLNHEKYYTRVTESETKLPII